MPIVARMKASEVIHRTVASWEACGPDDEGALLPEDAFASYTYGVPFWLRDAEYVRVPREGGVQEQFTLNAVRSGGPDDPNNDYFVASPNGSYSMTIDNPAAQNFIKPGEVYRVTIEKIRGPRSTD